MSTLRTLLSCLVALSIGVGNAHAAQPTPAQTSHKAVATLGHALTPEQTRGVLDAHLVGADIARGDRGDALRDGFRALGTTDRSW